MGMFDDIHFEKSPIEGKRNIKDFQTKSFECFLDSYRITENNKLQYQECTYREPKPEEQNEVAGVMLPLMVRENIGWKDMDDYVGTVYCYTSEEGVWYDVKITVIYGEVDKIEVEQREN